MSWSFIQCVEQGWRHKLKYLWKLKWTNKLISYHYWLDVWHDWFHLSSCEERRARENDKMKKKNLVHGGMILIPRGLRPDMLRFPGFSLWSLHMDYDVTEYIHTEKPGKRSISGLRFLVWNIIRKWTIRTTNLPLIKQTRLPLRHESEPIEIK